MEAIFYIVLIYGGIFLIGWFFEQIGKWNEERRSKIREEVVKDVVAESDLKDEEFQEYQKKLEWMGYQKNNNNDFWKYYLADGKKSYVGLVGECPSCHEGELRVVKGQYGKFLGCSKYPACKYTKNFKVAKQEYEDKSRKEFLDLFNSAYQ